MKDELQNRELIYYAEKDFECTNAIDHSSETFIWDT